MNLKLLAFCILVSACGGSLTDEQRKKAKASIALNQIKKISDSQITAAAFTYGQSVAQQVFKNNTQQVQKDSLSQVLHVKILSLHVGDPRLSEKEKLLVEAYAAITNPGDFSDNVQKISADSILYTKPVLKKNADGSTSFDYALAIRIPKKEIVLSIKN